MANPPRILAFSGSARRESLNKKFLAAAVSAVREAGGEITLIDLNDYVLPLYHGDLEAAQGLPENAQKLIDLTVKHDALLIGSPEYNKSITPLLKNTLDWMTRAEIDPFEGKVAAVVSASPGILGATHSQQLVRQLLLNLGCSVVPAFCVLPRAHEAFDEQGRLKDAKTQKNVQVLAAELIRLANHLSN
ncbi:MAG TPA: NAD(P)H-dependent oxidoreductase [Opitutaceae bacterium]|jgi:chromate reductase|nr:NAD(P)H-dependent oxidoreductase [Opitutaceae bacterium]